MYHKVGGGQGKKEREKERKQYALEGDEENRDKGLFDDGQKQNSFSDRTMSVFEALLAEVESEGRTNSE